eukprot:scaffold196601_cov30-Tisochrysis_lutea.AAC.3
MDNVQRTESNRFRPMDAFSPLLTSHIARVCVALKAPARSGPVASANRHSLVGIGQDSGFRFREKISGIWAHFQSVDFVRNLAKFGPSKTND